MKSIFYFMAGYRLEYRSAENYFVQVFSGKHLGADADADADADALMNAFLDSSIGRYG